MPIPIGMIAAQAAQAAIGLGMQNINDQRQLKQQGKLLEQQAAVDQRQAQFNQQLRLQTWKKMGYATGKHGKPVQTRI